MTGTDRPAPPVSGPQAPTRRRFLGYVLAAPTLTAAAQLAPAPTARADIPSPEITELVDLNDVMTAAALPTSGLITVEVNEDGTVSFALPRAEVGQGITTSTAMLIAEEMDVPVDRVRVTRARSWSSTSSPARLTRPSRPMCRSASPPPSPAAGSCGPRRTNSARPSPTSP
jgi:isoquinoline 1-oxidoreductase beta subunit